MRSHHTYTVALLLLIAAACGMAPISARAQREDPLLERFTLNENNGSVLLDWTTRPGTTCDGVDVLRSTDSLNYTLLYHIPGICGGPDDSYSYSYLDENPVPNFRNYYRLGLGSTGNSLVRAIDIIQLNETGFQIRPNPVVDRSTLYFENGSHALCTLTVIDLRGIVIRLAETRDDHFILDASTLLPQAYAFKVVNADGKLLARGRFLVGR